MALEQAGPKHGVAGTWRRAGEYTRLIAGSVGQPKGALYRIRWPWDARAGGLVVFAERGLIPNRDFTSNDNVREVAPALVDLQMHSGGRRYIVRPLPGQTLELYEKACPALVLHWRASQVTAQIIGGSKKGRGLIALEAYTSADLDNPIKP